MNILIGIQARTDSARLPRKIFEDIHGKTMLYRVVSNCYIELPKKIAQVTVAVLAPEEDQEIEKWCEEKQVKFYGGDKEDLVKRYIGAVEKFGADAVVRVTADCPFIPRNVVHRISTGLFSYDYVCNTISRTMPEGWDCQGISKEALQWVDENQKEAREHPFSELDANQKVRNQFVSDGFTLGEVLDSSNPCLKKTSVDTREDLKVANEYAKQLELGQKS